MEEGAPSVAATSPVPRSRPQIFVPRRRPRSSRGAIPSTQPSDPPSLSPYRRRRHMLCRRALPTAGDLDKPYPPDEHTAFCVRHLLAFPPVLEQMPSVDQLCGPRPVSSRARGPRGQQPNPTGALPWVSLPARPCLWCPVKLVQGHVPELPARGMSAVGGGGGSQATTTAAAAAPTAKAPHPPPRARPCDTCRLRKTRCVKEGNRTQCVLCAFHGQRCTFLKGPLPRQRRVQTAPHIGPNKLTQRRDSADESTARQRPTASSLVQGEESPGDSTHGVASPSDSRRPGSSPPASNHSDLAAPPDGIPVSPPAILDDTLGLDLTTHAEYVGPTDYRDPILLDLHRPPSALTARAPTAPELARRLDDQTIFIVRADEAVTSEAQRVADLDAIEAAVHPLGRTLVDLYFRIVHPSFPILHKDVFISKHRISHRHFAPSLLAAVYLVALDWQLYDSVLAGSECVPDAASLERLAEQTINRDMRRPKLSIIEAGLLLLQRHRRPGDHGDNNTSSRAFAAQLVAVAQDLGLHLDCSSWSIPSWEMGLRRRLAWAIYMEDRWGAFVHGRPCLIHDDDWDVRPCTDSDFPELASQQELGAAVDMDARIGWDIFCAHIELTCIVTDVLRTFFSLKATRAAGLLDQIGIAGAVDLAQPLVVRLRTWYAALPDALHLRSKQRGKLCANGSLHLAYASMEIAIHRALLRALTPDTSEAVRSRVRSAARSKLQVATELMASLEPEHTAAFWGRAAAHQAAHVGSLGALLWATAETAEEMGWCAARVDELRWALRVRGSAAPFARDALWLLEHDIGGVGVVRATREEPS